MPLAWVPRQSGRCCCAAAFACIKSDFAVIASMSAFSRARFRSASLSVTPNHLVRDTIESLLGKPASRPQPILAINLIAVILGRKQYEAARVPPKSEKHV